MQTDPIFEEPWEHEAEGYRIRQDLRSADGPRRSLAEVQQFVWGYKDARLRQDDRAASAAWQGFRQLASTNLAQADDHWLRAPAFGMVRCAVEFGDVDEAARELLSWYPTIDYRDLDNHNLRRADVRLFMTACVHVLESEASADRPWTWELDRAMREVSARAEDALMPSHQDGFWRIGEMRAFHRAQVAIAEEARTRWAIRAWLPGVGPARPWTAQVTAALEALEMQDDTGPLDALIRRLEGCELVSLRQFLLARRRIAEADLDAAEHALDAASQATDRLVHTLLPRIHATKGWLDVLRNVKNVDTGIEHCRTGRSLALHWWRRTTSADTSLIKLLLWRAHRPEADPGTKATDLWEARTLAQRLCRSWRQPGTTERLLLLEARSAWLALSGKNQEQRLRTAWSRSTEIPSDVFGKLRLTTGWVAWAIGTRNREVTAEAYHCLVKMVPLDVAARHGESVRQRVLAAAQRHTEEAGYWLARTGRFRDAVTALETGRAIGISEVDGRDGDVSYRTVRAATRDGALIYLAAANAGGYALIVAATHDPQFVELAKLDRQRVAPLVTTMMSGAVDGDHTPVRELSPVHPSSGLPAAVLPALWNDGLRDLLLFHARGRVLTFIPVGLLSLMPLHAAGPPGPPSDETAEWRYVGHFSAVRYAPNARSLERCRANAVSVAAAPPRLLAVNVPDGHGIDPARRLQHVARETTEIMRRWNQPGTVINDCTWEEFRTAAMEHTVWHLACHGAARPATIMDSLLCFADKQVSLRELRTALPADHRRLAVLSACETNLIGMNLPNESVGFPTALLQLGFAGVIASAWKVDDLATAYLMTEFYNQWCGEGHEPAVALNRAQQWLRTAAPTELTNLLPDTEPPSNDLPPYASPLYWAAFAYTGA